MSNNNLEQAGIIFDGDVVDRLPYIRSMVNNLSDMFLGDIELTEERVKGAWVTLDTIQAALKDCELSLSGNSSK